MIAGKPLPSDKLRLRFQYQLSGLSDDVQSEKVDQTGQSCTLGCRITAIIAGVDMNRIKTVEELLLALKFDVLPEKKQEEILKLLKLEAKNEISDGSILGSDPDRLRGR